jgi:GGDEF domain-containing protein
MPYELSLSMGYDIFDINTEITVEQFIHHIDNLMYEDKKKNKKNNAEK